MPTMYKRNAGFVAKLNVSSRNKIRDKMKISSSKTRTTLILDRYQQAETRNNDRFNCEKIKSKKATSV